MHDLRPRIDNTTVIELLNQHFSTPITDLAPLEGGSVARTFLFKHEAREYVLRFTDDNMMGSNLPKEAYIAHKLAGTGIPIPPILHVGRVGTQYYAISQKMPGRMVVEHPPHEVREFMPQIIAMLDIIHHVDVSDTNGYGGFDQYGVGAVATWAEMFMKIADEDEEGTNGYYGKWHHLFEDTFLERELFFDLYQRMIDLLAYVPSDRQLLHGNYSFNNILVENGRVTAIIDWLSASYGDFVYDIAGLDFWCPGMNIGGMLQEYYQQRGRALPAYEERLLCYQYYNALVGMLFFAKGGNEAGYQWTRQNILAKR